MNAAGVNSETAHTLSTVDFYTSHEALLLEYEEALCRIDSITGQPVAGSGHMIWIGDRTRQPDGAHVEFCRGVLNPIGLKCGPTTTADDLKVLMAKLNPANEAGPPDADRAVRRGQGRRTSAAPDQGGAGGGRECGLVLRPDAWQHDQGGLGLQDPAVRSGAARGAGVLRRSTRPRAPSPAACISR